ncbi:trypsin-like peptidase domain-containing protein, partial [bacterium]|nr:trypsin-like peptidase domain-containing protein [bacterium]
MHNDALEKEKLLQEQTKSASSNEMMGIKRNYLPAFLGTVIVVLIILIIQGVMWMGNNYDITNPFRHNASQDISTSETSLVQSSLELASLSLQESLSSAISAVRPMVVYIVAEGVQSQSSVGRPQRGVAFMNPAAADSPEKRSAGSGFIVDQRGYIITNQHVIANATSVNVTLFGAEPVVYPAEIVLQDQNQDLAILKIASNREFPAAKLGNSEMIEVGDIVLAIGSPFGLEQTVTMGIISDDRRNMTIEGRLYEDLIQ